LLQVRISLSGRWAQFLGVGAHFFLRRTFKGAVLYARVFSAYIHKLLEEGFQHRIVYRRRQEPNRQIA
jgi:glycerol-3-phosphate O-acyltransferase